MTIGKSLDDLHEFRQPLRKSSSPIISAGWWVRPCYFQAMQGFIFVVHQMDLVSGSQNAQVNLPSWRDNTSSE